MFLNFIDYEHALDSADRKGSAKVLFLHGIPNKYIIAISDMREKNIAEIEVGNKVSYCFGTE